MGSEIKKVSFLSLFCPISGNLYDLSSVSEHSLTASSNCLIPAGLFKANISTFKNVKESQKKYCQNESHVYLTMCDIISQPHI